MKALIVSDGKKGHLNQALAYCRLSGLEFEIVEVRYKNRFLKAVSYLLDKLGVFTFALFEPFELKKGKFDKVIGVGSSTYYFTKGIAKRLGAKAVALNYPKGFAKGFNLIYSPAHDRIQKKGVKEIPINFAYLEEGGIYTPKKRCVALVIGGDNKVFKMEKAVLKEVVDYIFTHFQEYEKVVTTSPRTPKEVEEWIEKLPFDYKLIYSKNRLNPLGDFVKKCEIVFITIDSTSMISEAVSGGKASVEVIMLPSRKRKSKYLYLVESLAKKGYLHLFDFKIASCNRKIDLKEYL